MQHDHGVKKAGELNLPWDSKLEPPVLLEEEEESETEQNHTLPLGLLSL